MAHNYIEEVEKKRGKHAANQLRGDCAEQWKRGNRGARGEWL